MRRISRMMRAAFRRRTCRFCGEGECLCQPLDWYNEVPGVPLAVNAARAGGRAAVQVVHRVRTLPMPQLPAWDRGEIYSSI